MSVIGDSGREATVVEMSEDGKDGLLSLVSVGLISVSISVSIGEADSAIATGTIPKLSREMLDTRRGNFMLFPRK
jgi:hypothetical protein